MPPRGRNSSTSRAIPGKMNAIFERARLQPWRLGPSRIRPLGPEGLPSAAKPGYDKNRFSARFPSGAKAPTDCAALTARLEAAPLQIKHLAALFPRPARAIPGKMNAIFERARLQPWRLGPSRIRPLGPEGLPSAAKAAPVPVLCGAPEGAALSNSGDTSTREPL
jgi:hypothetical protein